MSISTLFRHSTLRRGTAATVAGLALAATAVAAAPAQAVAAAPAPAKVVSRADVDGDGRADRTTIVRTTAHGDEAWRLTTRTAKGRTSSVVVEAPWLYGSPAWYGASRLDGQKGSELVVRSGFGAHTSFFRVFTWRAGKLVAQTDPSTGELDWVTDGALSVSQGYRVTTSGGRRVLVASQYLRDFSTDPDVMSGTVQRFAWRRGAWRPLGTHTATVRDTAPQVAAAYGWNAPGLPRD